MTEAGPRVRGGTRPSQSQADAAYALLKRQILRCELAPGEHVTERALTEQTGYGKTPVREALGRLAADGLVTTLPRQGYRVTTITIGDVEQLYEVWLMIGPAIARMAIERDADRLMSRVAELLPRVVDSQIEVGREVLATLARATGNRRLVELALWVNDGLARVFTLAERARAGPGPREEIVRAMIAAIHREDGVEIERRMAEWIRGSHTETMAVLRSLPSVLDAPVHPA